MNDVHCMPREIVEGPCTNNWTVFLEGPAGTGKTTLAIGRMRHLLEQGVPAWQVMILVPQRTLGMPYLSALQRLEHPGAALVDVATVGGLARRNIELFWPLIARKAGFAYPARPPVFLTLETAQYYMHRVTALAIEARQFEGITVPRNRLVSQLIDNLNKAAVVGFPLDEIAPRLKGSWSGESSHVKMFDEAQACAQAFRQYCLDHNLLDFSLQIEVFLHHLLPLRAFREYFFGRFRHLIVDNVEEDTPIAHDFLRMWLAECESALVVYDQDGGYRAFLGADPESAYALKDACRRTYVLERSLVTTPGVETLRAGLVEALGGPLAPRSSKMRPALEFVNNADYQPDLLATVSQKIRQLVDTGIAPREIVVLAPFLTDSLRFVLAHELSAQGLPVRSHRPSRALRDEPATRCLLTIIAIAHPHWQINPGPEDVAQALMQAIEGMDWVRAQLLTQVLYRSADGIPYLASFDHLVSEMQDRLTYSIGERYERLRRWLEDYRQRAAWFELDHFLSLLFGEVLSQRGFGFHKNYDAATQTARMIASIRKFRQAVDIKDLPEGRSVGQEYIAMVQQGIIAAQYVESWDVPDEDAVLLAPAYTFLMYNRPVDYQFWLNPGSPGWWERIYQPVTHPYVLSRHWKLGQVWTDADEFAARQAALLRLAVGLLRRCRKGVYVGIARYSEQGYEETGPLLQAMNRLVRRFASWGESDVQT